MAGSWQRTVENAVVAESACLRASLRVSVMTYSDVKRKERRRAITCGAWARARAQAANSWSFGLRWARNTQQSMQLRARGRRCKIRAAAEVAMTGAQSEQTPADSAERGRRACGGEIKSVKPGLVLPPGRSISRLSGSKAPGRSQPASRSISQGDSRSVGSHSQTLTHSLASRTSTDRK